MEVGSVTVLKILKIENSTREDILEAMKQLTLKQSQGPDQIPIYIFKGCADLLVEHLEIILFNANTQNISLPWEMERM